MMESTKTNIAVLLTCHNRRELTLSALRALCEPEHTGELDIAIFLVDDGSKDDTAAAVRAEFPKATIIQGDGNLYWNRGMRLAWQAALDWGADFYLWLNDDLCILPGSLKSMVEHYHSNANNFDGRLIIVGKTVSPASGKVTYGGYVRTSGLSRLRFRHLHEDEHYCDTMNGNCVLLPADVTKNVGINSTFYSHAFGDVDYGLRAANAGYTIMELPAPVGYQEVNEAYAINTATLSPRNYRFILFHPKGIPTREWFMFCYKHGGWLWLFNYIYRYVKIARI